MPKKPGPKAKKGAKGKRPPTGVSTLYLADMLGLSEVRISQLVEMGMPKAGRGMFPTRDAVRWYVEFLRKGGEKQTDGPTRADIGRDLDALKLKKLQGEVFDRREVVDTMNGAYERLGAAHELLTTRIGRELNLGTDDAKAVREMIDETRRAFVEDMGEFIDPVQMEDDDSSAAAA